MSDVPIIKPINITEQVAPLQKEPETQKEEQVEPETREKPEEQEERQKNPKSSGMLQEIKCSTNQTYLWLHGLGRSLDLCLNLLCKLRGSPTSCVQFARKDGELHHWALTMSTPNNEFVRKSVKKWHGQSGD